MQVFTETVTSYNNKNAPLYRVYPYSVHTKICAHVMEVIWIVYTQSKTWSLLNTLFFIWYLNTYVQPVHVFASDKLGTIFTDSELSIIAVYSH